MHKEFDQYENNQSRGIQSESPLENENNGDKRYVADDFKDNDTSSSLWVGSGKEHFFSTGGARKEKGDLITINVYQKLKDQIVGEVSRMYSPETDAKTASSATNNSPQANAKEASSVDKNNGSNDIHDKISVVVSKEVRENHLILTGRKQIIYNNNRHLVEVQALIHRKDVGSDDTLDSKKIIQSTIRVIR